MFNKNGSNNGNGSANGVHKDTAVVARNGNGHRPDAAPVSSTGQAIVTEHDLLWDGLSPAVSQALGQPIDPELVSQRKGRGGRVFDYLEGHAVIDQANRIFGFGGWGYELVGDVTLRRVETVDPQTGEVKVDQGYSAPVRVTVAGALPRTDIGVHPVAEDNFDGHDTAMKGAVTDGLKRAFRSFGVQFGNGFYGDQPQVGNQPQPQRVPAPANGNSGRAQSNGKSPVRRSGSGQAQRVPGGDAAEAALRDCRRAGPRRGPGAERRGRPDGQEHRRPDGRRAGAAGRGRRQQAPADAAGPVCLARRSIGIRIRAGPSHSWAAPLLHYRTRRLRAMTTTETLVSTPWGWTHDIEELAEGVWRVWTPSHGGLKLSRERWAEIPDCVRSAMFTPTFAEEDCEEPIVRTLLGIGDDREREMALKVAGYFDRYAPALPYLRDCPPGIHYHAIAFSGGLCTDPFGRFDTRIEAESFVGDAEMVRAYGRMEAIECSRALPLCRAEGGRP